jgi:hypothetical protein
VHEPGAWGRPHPRSGWNVCQRGESLGEIAVSPRQPAAAPILLLPLATLKLFRLGRLRGFD